MFSRLLIVFLIILTSCLLAAPISSVYPQLFFSVQDIKNPVFQTRAITVQMHEGHAGQRQLDINVEEVAIHDYVFRDIHIVCRTFQLEPEEIQCIDGKLHIKDLLTVPVSLQFSATHSQLNIHLRPSIDEHWQFTLRWDDVFWQAILAINAGRITQFTAWIPDNKKFPQLTDGNINGLIQLDGDREGLSAVHADLTVDELAFSDQTGMHAGENIKLAIISNAKFDTQHAHWNLYSEIHWQQGAVFWQPLFFSGTDHHLNIHGIFDEKTLHLKNSHLILDDIGTINFSSVVDWLDLTLNSVELTADHIALSTVFEQILKPFLSDTILADLEISGHGDVALRIHEGVLQEIDMNLDDVNIIDKRNRFAFHRINAHIPWQSDNTTIADISLLKGHILRIPFGSMRVPLEINDFTVLLPQMAIPVLDGTLKLEEFSAAFTDDGWQWQFGGALTPVSMEALTDALQIQSMHGILSGYIPEVRFDGDSVSVNGVLQINVFDGSVVIHKLKLIEPMGLAPHLTADIAMRNLDLGLLTRTFSFGKMDGRVDIDVSDLELTNWKPIHFDAHLFSSPGKYTRRISQAAIQNISALGGEGAVVAIQRSFLRFFEEFSYAEIGWRCALRFHICYMGGIESEPNSKYTLIKGGGIPAINVMGYNREVGWQELIGRLQRITQEHDPIIQ